MYPAAPQGGMTAFNMSLGMVTPVNDLRGSDSISYEKGEKLLRCKLAAFYRLTDLFGWSQLIYNHLTVRVNSDQERFLIVPFGLLYSEVSASSLVKINTQGEIVDRGSTNLGVNQAGFTLHSAIYAARPDIKCIVHVHTPAGAAVSAMKCGLLPISPEALTLGEVAYHDYHGILIDEEENVLIQKNLGPTSKVSEGESWTNEEGMRQAAVANQFVPLNTNPKEVLEMRNKIREQNLKDITTAGPESQVLCAGSMVDRSFIQGELVTASKAIIEKEYQPRVIINKKGPNPFNKQYDQELEDYRKEVELKQKGPDVQGEESFQLSSAGPGEGLSPSTSPQKPPLPPKPLCIPEQGAGVGLVIPGVSEPTPTASSKAASPSSSLPSRDILTGSGGSQGSPGTSTGSGTGGYGEESPSESPHKEFHCAVLKALSTTNTELPALTEVPDSSDALPEPEEEAKGQSPTRTPPSTPVRAEEDSQLEHTYKDESDQATLRQTLPDLTPDDEPSDAPVPALPAEDPATPAATEQTTAVGEEPADAAGDQDCEQDGDESPSKSPSKKKKKFRTPSFLKKNKKKTEEKEGKSKEP
ncbi:unnamed protein product [Oncorhynchus mykiss]|uniref:Class II aldolase/adducin N-terminal domain-containing protein n=1 Tax=Oncorhynchus mykiss TaxID=8022 RepID=A0A060VZM1_ONCMY|nr:unnamed protein product [Oncorhynchus mykiss]